MIVLSIVIPCLNEQATIKRSVNDAKRHAEKYFKGKYELIVADNGSTDGTIEILKKLNSLKVINVPVRGYGAALHWGIMNARGDYVLFADADLSYPFSNIGKFKKILNVKPDLLLGSRIKGNIEDGSMPFLHRYIGTPALTQIIRLIYKIPTTDCNSGMRIVKRSFYKNLKMRNSGMEWASELLLKTALKNGKYLEVPINFKKDKRNRKPHLSTWSDGWRHLKAIFLLKPASLLYVMIAFLFTAIVLYPSGFGLTTLFLLLAVVIFFSLLALEFLSYALEGSHNYISKVLNSNWLVPVVLVIVTISGVIIYVLPNDRLGTKMILAAIDSVMLIWVFLIETIKTHLVNRLPDIKIYK